VPSNPGPYTFEWLTLAPREDLIATYDHLSGDAEPDRRVVFDALQARDAAARDDRMEAMTAKLEMMTAKLDGMTATMRNLTVVIVFFTLVNVGLTIVLLRH